MARTWYEIPMSPNSQTFFIQLGNNTYHLKVMYRDCEEGGWVIDISDNNQKPLVQGIPVVTGVDLLRPYAYLNFGGALIVTTDGDTFAVPTYSNFGKQSHLYFGITNG